MKRIVLALVFLVGCGGSSGPDLSKFEGNWSGNLTTTVTCGGQSQSGNAAVTLGLSAGSGADLQYLSQGGCLFKFNVSGNTASLANAPVTCSTTSNGAALVLNFTSYSLSTSDGHSLTATAGGTVTSGGENCTVAITGSAAR
jgi:hypothetical protein